MSLRSDVIQAKKFDESNSKFKKSPSWKQIVRQTIKDIIRWFHVH
jgi:hypothetical protein